MKEKKFIFPICLVLIAIISIASLLYLDYQQSNLWLGIKHINQQQFVELTKDKTYQWIEQPQLIYNEYPLPYVDDLYAYFLSQPNDHFSKDGHLSTHYQDYQLMFITDYDIAYHMENNIPIQLLMINDSYYDIKDIRLTSLPTLFINPTDATYQQFKMLLYNPNNQRNLYEICESYVRYGYRGNATLIADKHQYRLDTINKDGSNNPLSLLDMRKDDDWVLNSFVVDTSMMREQLVLDLYNRLYPEFAHKIEYVELILDGRYQGVYGLMERVDFKTMNASKKDDFSINIVKWGYQIENPKIDTMTSIKQAEYNPEKQQCKIDEFEIRNCNPDNFNDILAICKQLKIPNNTLRFDIESSVAVDLLNSLTVAVDSTYKNARILARLQEDGSYVLYKANWDNDFNYTIIDGNSFSPITDLITPTYIVNSEEYQQMQKELYLKILPYYNETYILNLIDTLDTQLRQSGAPIRDNALWQETYAVWTNTTDEYTSAVDFLKDNLPNFINQVTTYYNHYLNLTD